MGFLDKLWDDHIGGPQPDKGLGKLREPAGLPDGFDIDSSIMVRRNSADYQQQENDARRITQSISIKKPSFLQTGSDTNEVAGSPAASSPMASSPIASPGAQDKDNVWRSVFHPGQNKNLKKMGSSKFDNVTPNANTSERSPSVYDWLYHPKSKSEYR